MHVYFYEKIAKLDFSCPNKKLLLNNGDRTTTPPSPQGSNLFLEISPDYDSTHREMLEKSENHPLNPFRTPGNDFFASPGRSDIMT